MSVVPVVQDGNGTAGTSSVSGYSQKMRCLFVLISFAIYAIIQCEMLDGGCRVFLSRDCGIFCCNKRKTK